MNFRLQQFLSAENITQAQFADSIGVARASVSHILAGRNKPGFDFIESMAKHYPNINLEWLISGKGRMYKLMQGPYDEQDAMVESAFNDLKTKTLAPQEDDLFANVPEEKEHEVELPVFKPTPTPKVKVAVSNELETNKLPKTTEKVPVSVSDKRTVSKIVVFYNDGTYQEMY